MFPQAHRHFKTFVGIDLGGGRGKNTAVAVVNGDGGRGKVVMASQRNGEGSPWYDDVLTGYLEALGSEAETVVAVDGPLTVPSCIRCALDRCPGILRCPDPAVKWLSKHPARAGDRGRSRKPRVTPYTQRVTEVLLQKRFGRPLREALGQSLGPVTARAHHLAKRWHGKWELNVNLLEVCPRATVFVLCGEKAADGYRKRARVWEARAGILEALGRWLDFQVWRESVLRNTHVFEAVICALTGMLWATQGWVVPSAFEALARADGWIWTPDEPGDNGQ